MRFDDRDPAIVYNAQHWGVEENPGEFDGTSTFCNIVGGTATFNFNGPATISVVGVVQATSFHLAGRSTYSIDGGIPQTFNPPSPNTPQFGVQFFTASVTSSGSHQLVITTLDGNNHFVYIDYIDVVPLPQPSPTHNSATTTHQDTPPPPPSPTATSAQITTTITTTNAQGATMTVIQDVTVPVTGGGSNTQAAGPDTQSSPRSGAIQTGSSLSSPTVGGTAGSGTSHVTGPSQTASASSQVVTVVNGVTFTTFLPPTASSPSLDTTSSPQVAAAPAHHVSLGVIIGPVIGALVILALLLLAAICYARSWFKRVLKSKEEEAASEAPSSTAPPVSEAASTTPVSNDTLSRWMPGAASRRLMSVSPFMLGDDNAAAPPPYRPASGKLEMPVKPGSSTSPMNPPLL